MTPEETRFEEIIAALKVDELSESEQEEFLLELNDIVLKSTLARIIERMDDTTRDDFAALLDREASDDEVEAFLAERVPEAAGALDEAIADITSDIKESAKL